MVRKIVFHDVQKEGSAFFLAHCREVKVDDVFLQVLSAFVFDDHFEPVVIDDIGSLVIAEGTFSDDFFRSSGNSDGRR